MSQVSENVDRLGLALLEHGGLIEGHSRFAGAPVAMGQREVEGGVLGEGKVMSVTAGPGVAEESAPDSDSDIAVRRLVDFMVPSETAVGAVRVFERYRREGYDLVYAMQRAFIFIAESEGWHRGGGR